MPVEISTMMVTKLLILWQRPSDRAMVPVAILSYDGELYEFEYLSAARSLDEFRPLLGFRDLDRRYTSDEMFPLFQERVLDPTRPDFGRVLDELALSESEATPWELLVRTGGTSEGDTLQVTPFPHESDSGWIVVFLAAGLRYFQEKTVRTALGTTHTYTEDEFHSILDSLAPGDPLVVRTEIGNDYNPDAQLLFTSAGDVIGYLPDWLARFAAPCVHKGMELSAHVERVNDKSVGWHLRLMVSAGAPESFEEAGARLLDGSVLRY